MKISQLTQIAAAQRGILLPLSINGQNMSITLGQIMDALSKTVVPFKEIVGARIGVTYAPGTSAVEIFGAVIFDKPSNKFWLSQGLYTDISGLTEIHWTYFENWHTRTDYYDEDGNVRTDCLFISQEGRLYSFAGNNGLKSVGLTDEQAKQIRLSTPIEVADEQEMEQRIAAGEYEDGQIYFVAEEE